MKKKNNSRCIFKAIILWLTCLYCISDALVSEKLLLYVSWFIPGGKNQCCHIWVKHTFHITIVSIRKLFSYTCMFHVKMLAKE